MKKYCYLPTMLVIGGFICCATFVADTKPITFTADEILIGRSAGFEDCYHQVFYYNDIERCLAKIGGVDNVTHYAWERFMPPFEMKQQIFFAAEHFSTHILVVGYVPDHSVVLVKRMGPDLKPFSRSNWRLFDSIMAREELAPLTPLKMLQLSVLYLKIFAAAGDVELSNPSRKPCHVYIHGKHKICFSARFSSRGTYPTSPIYSWKFVYDQGGRLVKVEGAPDVPKKSSQKP
jgi:hypothetical protein